MTASKCQRCGSYWSHATGRQEFKMITSFCPNCIAVILPIMGVATMPRRVAS